MVEYKNENFHKRHLRCFLMMIFLKTEERFVVIKEKCCFTCSRSMRFRFLIDYDVVHVISTIYRRLFAETLLSSNIHFQSVNKSTYIFLPMTISPRLVLSLVFFSLVRIIEVKDMYLRAYKPRTAQFSSMHSYTVD